MTFFALCQTALGLCCELADAIEPEPNPTESTQSHGFSHPHPERKLT